MTCPVHFCVRHLLHKVTERERFRMANNHAGLIYGYGPVKDCSLGNPCRKKWSCIPYREFFFNNGANRDSRQWPAKRTLISVCVLRILMGGNRSEERRVGKEC